MNSTGTTSRTTRSNNSATSPSFLHHYHHHHETTTDNNNNISNNNNNNDNSTHHRQSIALNEPLNPHVGLTMWEYYMLTFIKFPIVWGTLSDHRTVEKW